MATGRGRSHARNTVCDLDRSALRKLCKTHEVTGLHRTVKELVESLSAKGVVVPGYKPQADAAELSALPKGESQTTGRDKRPFTSCGDKAEPSSSAKRFVTTGKFQGRVLYVINVVW